MVENLIPSDIDEIYMALFQAVSHLHRKWGVFRHLYVSEQEVVDLINEAGRDFFASPKPYWPTISSDDRSVDRPEAVGGTR